MAVVGSLAECGRSASAHDCHSMAEHYLDLAVRENAGSTTMTPAQLAAVRQIEDGIKHAEPTYREVVDRCSDVDRVAVPCALRASTASDWEACLRPSSSRR